MQDILFSTERGVFSYRVGGVLLKNGQILLQRDKEGSYATVGGHVMFGETVAQALVREFEEEVHLQIRPERLLAVQENFFSWQNKPWHQIHFYYRVSPLEGHLPDTECLPCYREDGTVRDDLEMVWVPLKEVSSLEVYPQELPQLLTKPEAIQHFISREL